MTFSSPIPSFSTVSSVSAVPNLSFFFCFRDVDGRPGGLSESLSAVSQRP